LGAGNYTVTVTDANGCTATNTVSITQTGTFAVNVNTTAATCGTANGTATAATSGGTLPYTYLWSGGQTTSSISGLLPGTYTVTVTEGTGCVITDSVAVVVGPLNLSFTVASDTCNRKKGTATVTASGGTAPYAYLWSNGETTSQILSLAPQTYSVVITDAAGCTGSDTVSVSNMLTAECVFVPNAFSPNGDGQHDLWVIDNISFYDVVKVEVYNRWGNLVYESSDYQNDWDGTRNGKKLPGGVYFYIIDFNNGEKPLAGTLTLIQ
jgi:gliding motility-associated-like protein